MSNGYIQYIGRNGFIDAHMIVYDISSTPSRLSVSAAFAKSGFCAEGILSEDLK